MTVGLRTQILLRATMSTRQDMDKFVQEAQADAAQAVKDLKGDRKRDRLAVAETVRLAVRRAAQRWSGKKPVVQVLLREG